MYNLEKNLSCIEKINPQFASYLRSLKKPENIEVAISETSKPTIFFTTRDKKKILLHSRYDPEKEAENFISQFQIEPLDTIIVLGFGMGYHIKELFKKKSSENHIFVFEKDIGVFRTAIENLDFSDVLSETKTFVFVGIDPEDVYGIFRNLIHTTFASNIHLIQHNPSYVINGIYYDRIVEKISDFRKSAEVIIKANLQLSRKTFENRFNNIKDYVITPGVEIFENRFKNFPAIIASAGPSLYKNLDHLKKIKGKAVLIAVSTCLKTLLKNGIVPDFSCVLDYHRLSRRYFEGIDEKNFILICDPRASYESVDVFYGNKIFFYDFIIDSIIKGLKIVKGKMEYGATVAHLAFYFAEYIGANPIVFVGQDLCYPYNITHTPQTAIHNQWSSEVSRFNFYENKEFDFIVRMRQKLIKIKDVNGNDVYTDEGMFSYLKDFGLLCSAGDRFYINATEGGANISGTTHTKLFDVINKYCQKNIPVELFKYDEFSEETKKNLFFKARVEISERIREFSRLEKVLKKILKELENANKLLEEGKIADEIVKSIEPMKKRLEKFKNLVNLMRDLARTDEFERYVKDRSIKAKSYEGIEKQKQQCKRDIEFVKALINCSDFIRKLLEKSKARLEL